MAEDNEDSDEMFDGIEDAEDDSRRRQFKPRSKLQKALGTTASAVLLKYLDPPWLEADRPRGVLSTVDREFLFGQKDYAHKQSRSNRRQTIRERVEHSLYDLTLLWMVLPPLERERVLDTMDDTNAAASIEGLITFAYVCTDRDVTELERRIENGVLAGASYDPESEEDGRVTDVGVSIDIEYQPTVDELQRKLQDDSEELTPAEIGILVKTGSLDPENIEDLEEERLESLSGSLSGIEENS